MPRSLLPVGALLAMAAVAPLSPAAGQICPPAPGVEVPAQLRAFLSEHPDAFQLRRAWIQKTQRAAQARARLGQVDVAPQAGSAQRPSPALQSGSAAPPGSLAQSTAVPVTAVATAVGGTFHIPVFMVKFANTPADPYPTQDLEQELFGGGASPRTLTDFYTEISGGRVHAVGQVYGWHQLPQNDTWYEGSSYGSNPSNAHVGDLIRHTLDAYDAQVDFGQYDNDGPDGIPNSGDDDGYVDFVAFVHPEQGGECGGSGNIWSHRWVYRAWNASGGAPYQTQDAAANGGYILIDDYTIQPAYSCVGTSQRIEIGVFCHEFGHAFGLPDLYDINGGSSGLGHWCLMASGNWNVPSSPAHMSAWSKRELGWVNTVAVDWRGTPIEVRPVEQSSVVYELGFTDDRWRRRTDCPLAGAASLAVGLTQDESAARGWAASKGYGNGWRETVAHDFHFSGAGPVSLSYRYAVQTEALYDYAFALVDVGDNESAVAVYDGTATGTASIVLTPLLGSAPTDYRVKFRFISDAYFSNEDGHYTAACSPFVVDDLRVQGGGESYAADFEQHLQGWYQPDTQRDNPRSERWLVENREAVGYDAFVPGKGLVIYHVDQEVIDSGNENTGGMSNDSVRGVVIEEADGLRSLLTGLNRGDGGDAFPGSSAKVTFDAASNPSSVSNSGHPTIIAVRNIDAAGENILATFTAGDPAPAFTGVTPDSAAKGSAEQLVTLLGAAEVQHGSTVRLVRPEFPPVRATRVVWEDRAVVGAAFDLLHAYPGTYSVVVENPDGQTAMVEGAFEVRSSATAAPPVVVLPAAYALAQNFPNPFNPSTTIRYDVPAAGRVRLEIYDVRGRVVRALVDGSVTAGYHQVVWDGRDDAGRSMASGLYFYRMAAGGFAQQKKLLLAK
jgi:M6 family metalloprotease-like protein